MQEVISAKLREIEQSRRVRILYCTESGSRAWGFASPDSDYDVRFIYVRPCEEYLRLGKSRDVIEWQLDDTLDINGWDLQKALRLLHGSNPTLFEWRGSPIVYKTTPEWELLSQTAARAFRPRAGLLHYLGMAKKDYREHLTGDCVRLKSYFYVLRSVLACRWILEKQTPPPVPFSELAQACLCPDLRPEVSALLRIKTETPELRVGPRIDRLNEYLYASIGEISERAKALPDDGPIPWEELDRLFLRILREKAADDACQNGRHLL